MQTLNVLTYFFSELYELILKNVHISEPLPNEKLGK